ncbi:MAG: EamA family transporter [Promethearchaeota archaeon]|nr:MAG: EamA family transporter [Candidatus Lokiarchaeota archaeon]
MEKKKGYIFGIICGFLIGIQPIIIIARPNILNPYIFAATSFLIVSIVFLPLMIMERKNLKAKYENGLLTQDQSESLLNGWKKNKKFLIYLGVLFGLGRIFYFIGFELAGAINGSLATKTRIIFALFLGYLFLNEKISKKQIVFSSLLLFGLFLAVTEFNVDVSEFNAEIILGVIILVIVCGLWTLAHTQTKPIIDSKEATPVSIVFIRSIIGAIVLFSTYILFFPFQVNLFYDPVNIFYFIAIGFVQGLGLFCWYKTISYMEFSKATILVAPTPIITALFAYFILGDPFTIFHLIGTIIVIFSIIMIVRERQSDDKLYEIN